MKTYKITLDVTLNSENIGWILESIREQLEEGETIHEWDCAETNDWEDKQFIKDHFQFIRVGD